MYIETHTFTQYYSSLCDLLACVLAEWSDPGSVSSVAAPYSRQVHLHPHHCSATTALPCVLLYLHHHQDCHWLFLQQRDQAPLQVPASISPVRCSESVFCVVFVFVLLTNIWPLKNCNHKWTSESRVIVTCFWIHAANIVGWRLPYQKMRYFFMLLLILIFWLSKYTCIFLFRFRLRCIWLQSSTTFSINWPAYCLSTTSKLLFWYIMNL